MNNREKAGLVGFGIGFGYGYNKTYDSYNALYGFSPDAALMGVFTGGLSYMVLQGTYFILTELI